ncbi:AAA family ATPase [Georgenia subflava]|uniref:AAA family ATPase n=1 Tax=Georgenia subflava TaxID=1622177 RepID=UPI0038602498
MLLPLLHRSPRYRAAEALGRYSGDGRTAALWRRAVRVGRVHLLYGLGGSGKTTRARELCQDGRAVRLTLDEWMIRLYPDVAFDSSTGRAPRPSRISCGRWPSRSCRPVTTWCWTGTAGHEPGVRGPSSEPRCVETIGADTVQRTDHT